jgi:hypothetical protein
VRVVDFNALAAVLTVEKCSGKKLTILFKYAAKNNPAAAESLSNLRYSRARLLIPMRLGRWTWDSAKDVASVPGSVSTTLLNELIVIFWKSREVKGDGGRYL